MNHSRIQLFHAFLFIALLYSPRRAVADVERPKTGQPHPPLVLPSAKDGEAFSIDTYRGKKVVLFHFATFDSHSYKQLLRWQSETKDLRKVGKLELIGVAHDPCADRVRLFSQWKRLEFPVVCDVLNLSRAEKLPSAVCLDGDGIVRETNATLKTFTRDFVNKEFARGRPREPVTELPDPRYRRRMAQDGREDQEWRKYAESLVLAGLSPQITASIEAFGKSIGLKAQNPYSHFGQGIAHHIRFDRSERQDGDLQAALSCWRKALSQAPHNEIFANLLKLYECSEGNPKDSYNWITTARKQIAARHEEPAALNNEPMLMEVAATHADGDSGRSLKMPKGFHEGASQDNVGLIKLEPVFVPANSDGCCRVLLLLRPSSDDASWDDKKHPLRLWIELPQGCTIKQPLVTCSPTQSGRERLLFFDFQVPAKRNHADLKFVLHGVYGLKNRDGALKSYWHDFQINHKLE